MSQRAKRPQKRPKHLEEYVLGTNKNSKCNDKRISEPAEIAMECSDENITFIPPKPKIAKLNNGPEVVNPMDPKEVPNAGDVGNFNTHGGVPMLPRTQTTQAQSKPEKDPEGAGPRGRGAPRVRVATEEWPRIDSAPTSREAFLQTISSGMI
jgi:hypothetical protein